MVPRLKRSGSGTATATIKSVEALKLEFAPMLPAQDWRYTEEQQQQLRSAASAQRRADRMQRASELATGSAPVTRNETHISQSIRRSKSRPLHVMQTREQPGQEVAGPASPTPPGTTTISRPGLSTTHTQLTERAAWLTGHMRELSASETPGVHATSVPGISWRIGLQLNTGAAAGMPPSTGGEASTATYPEVVDTPGNWRAIQPDVLRPLAPMNPPVPGMP